MDYIQNLEFTLGGIKNPKVDIRGKMQDDITFKLYENLNHAFVPSIYGNIMKARKEYNVEQHICDYVIDDIKAWVLAQ